MPTGKLVRTNQVKLGPPCPHCGGHGKVASTADHWRIDWHYQDGHDVQEHPELKSVRAVTKYLRSFRRLEGHPTAYAPDGRVYEWQS